MFLSKEVYRWLGDLVVDSISTPGLTPTNGVCRCAYPFALISAISIGHGQRAVGLLSLWREITHRRSIAPSITLIAYRNKPPTVSSEVARATVDRTSALLQTIDGVTVSVLSRRFRSRPLRPFLAYWLANRPIQLILTKPMLDKRDLRPFRQLTPRLSPSITANLLSTFVSKWRKLLFHSGNLDYNDIVSAISIERHTKWALSYLWRSLRHAKLRIVHSTLSFSQGLTHVRGLFQRKCRLGTP